jgi:acetoacetate decarboxylase
MGYKHRALDEHQARAEVATPAFMLKLLTSYDRTGLRICELIRMQITDITIKGAWTGPARLQLFEHALAPLADFPVREIVAASHIRTDLTLAQPTLVHDYLAEASAGGQ